MAPRKKTPDILGDLLGGSQLPDANAGKKSKNAPETDSAQADCEETPTDGKNNRAVEYDAEYFETLLVRAASALELVAEVLGRRRLVQWLDEMKATFSIIETPSSRKVPSTAFKQGTATWVENHLGAESVKIGHPANGTRTSEPYDVDIWAHLKGVGAQRELDIWIECRETRTPLKRKDVKALVDKATDVYHAAHTDKQEFWFDRLMLVSTVQFEPSVLQYAEEEGVACIFYDGTSYQFECNENWKLKPSWFREAEMGKGK